MRKSSNLSVRTRILGSVIITLLLTVVIAALAIFGVSSTQGEYLSVIQGPVAISDNVQDTELQVNIIARHLRDMALFGYDSGTVAEIQTSLDNLDASLSVSIPPIPIRTVWIRPTWTRLTPGAMRSPKLTLRCSKMIWIALAH